MLLVEGGLIALSGVLVGRLLPSRRRTPKPPASPRPICGCGHSIGFHSGGEKACAWVGETFYKTYVGSITPKCRCQRYDGPTPLPEFFAPEIGAGS